jgi:glycosyltransferase involved in cell wall biosynthesis
MTYKNDAISNRFSKILDKIKPDIVHIQHLLYLSTTVIEDIKKRDIPIVFTLHDYWLICPQGQLFKNNSTICDNKAYLECLSCIPHQLCIRKNVFYYYYFFKKILPDSLFQLIKKNYINYAKTSFITPDEAIKQINKRAQRMRDICSKVNLFIAPSNFLKKKFIEFGIPQEKILFSQYGFNLDRFKDFKKVSSNKLRFAFIGNILPAKGIHILIEAFNKVKNKDVELKIYGKVISYKGLLESYLKYIKDLAKNKNIRFMGGFDNRDIVNIFSQIDVLVIPSVWPENSPLVIQEAFASKTPVIASRVGGIPELIQDGVNGLLFGVNKVDSLYEKIMYIVDNPKLIEELKENIKPPKDIKVNAQEIEEIYKRLVKNVAK